MHRCLKVPEIVSLIFDNFIEPRVESPSIRRRWPFDGSGTLLSLATTRKSFTEPALERLWFFVPDFVLLVKTLPKKTWVEHDSEVHDEEGYLWQPELHVVRLCQHLAPRYLLRFRYYARKIHVLGEFYFGQDPETEREAAGLINGTHLHSLVLPVLLARHSNELPLLPSLQQFNATLGSFERQAWHARAAISDRITAINILGRFDPHWESAHEWLTILGKMIGQSTPLLQDLILPWPEGGPTSLHRTTVNLDIFNPLASSIPQLCFLRRLEIFGLRIKRDLLHHLTDLPSLQSLEVTVSSEAISDILNFQPYLSCRLENIALHTESLVQCTRFVKASAGRRVKSLHFIRMKTSTEKWDVETFTRSVSQLGSMSGITQIRLQAPILVLHSEDISLDISSEAIKPLLSFRQLKKLQISLDGHVNLDRNILEEMSKAWPSLKCLDLHERTIRTQPHITLFDAARFAASLPDLAELRLRVNAPNFDFHDVYGIPQSSNLICLDLCTSPISSESGVTRSIAQFLIFTFPQLRSIRYGWLYPGGRDDIPDEAERGHLQRWEDIRQLFTEAFDKGYDSEDEFGYW